MDWLIHALDLHAVHAGDFFTVATLIVLEGLLSCDNAVVLALLVSNLPKHQRGKALRYGIFGAYAFLIVAMSLATWIMTVWWLKMIGGLYLAWLAVDHFWKKCHGIEEHKESGKVRMIWGLGAFWSTVVWVELTDMVFSVDSIAVAVALSNKMWVLILGGMLCILIMRFAAQGFVILLQKLPRLESAAFAAVAVIGLKLILEVPVDLFGATKPLPEDTTYTTAAEYIDAVHKNQDEPLGIRGVIAINRSAPPAPIEAAFLPMAQAAVATEAPELTGAAREEWITKRADREQKIAKSTWALHFRPWIELESWISSVLVFVIFAFGFIPKRKLDATPEGHEPPAQG
jgi:YkoY family integral membrane protein